MDVASERDHGCFALTPPLPSAAYTSEEPSTNRVSRVPSGFVGALGFANRCTRVSRPRTPIGGRGRSVRGGCHAGWRGLGRRGDGRELT